VAKQQLHISDRGQHLQ